VGADGCVLRGAREREAAARDRLQCAGRGVGCVRCRLYAWEAAARDRLVVMLRVMLVVVYVCDGWRWCIYTMSRRQTLHTGLYDPACTLQTPRVHYRPRVYIQYTQYIPRVHTVHTGLFTYTALHSPSTLTGYTHPVRPRVCRPRVCRPRVCRPRARRVAVPVLMRAPSCAS
jgi:hypothetical protein